MKRLSFAVCIAVLLLDAAGIAFAAGTLTDWQIYMRASTPTYQNSNPQLRIGTSVMSQDGQDPTDVVFDTPDSNATVVSYRTGGNWTSPYWKKDLMAPVDYASGDPAKFSKSWDLLVWTTPDWSEYQTVRLAVWATSTYSPPEFPLAPMNHIGLVVVNDPTGTYSAGTFWEFTPMSVGTQSDPVFSVDFHSGHLIRSLDANAHNNGIQLYFGPILPEPGSLLALAGGLFGMAGYAIRRRRGC